MRILSAEQAEGAEKDEQRRADTPDGGSRRREPKRLQRSRSDRWIAGGEAVITAVAPERPGVKFLALSVSDAADAVISVIRAGARGYVTKTISGAEFRKLQLSSRHELTRWAAQRRLI